MLFIYIANDGSLDTFEKHQREALFFESVLWRRLKKSFSKLSKIDSRVFNEVPFK